MTTFIERRKSRQSIQGGFTLMEMMVVSAIGSIVIMALMMSYSMTTRGFVSAGNYSDLERDARITLDFLTRDARMATGLVSYASSDISLGIPTNFASNGSITGGKTIRYFQGSGATSNKLFRVDAGQTNTMADNVVTLQFIEYDRNLVTNGINPSDCKLLQVDLTLRKFTIDNPNTEQILSARIVLRNKLMP